MAIKHDLGEAGLSEWLTWSERSPKFELQEALETWASFKDKTPGRKITLGSIFHVAQALGWNREGTEKIPEHIARLNQNYFLAQRGGKTLIFKEGIDPCDGRPMLQAMKNPRFQAAVLQ